MLPGDILVKIFLMTVNTVNYNINMKTEIKIFDTPEVLAESFAHYFANEVRAKEKYNIAISGGSTPKVIFKVLADKYSNHIDWEKVHLFWGDERCVPPDNSESNYGMTKEFLIDKIKIPEKNIYRIKGEDEPILEAKRYSKIIIDNMPKLNDLPAFDFIMLGLGEDGHTASIFPDRLDLFQSDKICEVVEHPATHQNRITLTGRILNYAYSVGFFVTGKEKASIVKIIIEGSERAFQYPASHIQLVNGKIYWYLENESAALLKVKD